MNVAELLFQVLFFHITRDLHDDKHSPFFSTIFQEQKEKEQAELQRNAAADENNIEAVPLVSAGDSTEKRFSPADRSS